MTKNQPSLAHVVHHKLLVPRFGNGNRVKNLSFMGLYILHMDVMHLKYK
jgi:hypothetical protein